MNRSFKNIARGLLMTTVAVTFAASCSEWTEPESVRYEYKTLEQKNPELYQGYMQSLKDYHDSEHNVMIAKFDNTDKIPSGRAEHVNSLPDSVDYIVLTAPELFSDNLAADIEDVRTNKGTKMMGQIDFNVLLKAYNTYKAEWLEAHKPAPAPDGKADPEPSAPEEQMMDLATYVAHEMPKVMASFDRGCFDGINVIYSCADLRTFTEEAKVILKAEQSAFFTPVLEWVAAQEGRFFFIEGSFMNLLLDGDVAAQARYLLVPSQTFRTSTDYTFAIENILNAGNVPADRFVVVVTTVSLTDKSNPDGTFVDKTVEGREMSAIQGAAYWTHGTYDRFKPAGVAVDHAQNNYYNMNKVYLEIREAIGIMNPSPLK